MKTLLKSDNLTNNFISSQQSNLNNKCITLALDAMGGDNAPDMVIEGAHLAARKDSLLRFKFYGDQDLLNPLLSKYKNLDQISEIIHTKDFIKNDDNPVVALRQGRQSSMRLAIDAVLNGKARGVVSAGNTGAYMAMSKIFLKMIDGIDRPAIITSFPAYNKPCVMLDLGANVTCTADNLVQFAVMGNVYAKEILGVKNPTIGLLNVGAEEQKGNIAVQEAAKILRPLDPSTLNFFGFIEGDDIVKGTVDVVVTDGFTGNVTLKTIEGMVFFTMNMLKDVFKTSLFAKIGYLFTSHALKPFKDKLNPKYHNGAMFIGLEGIAIKSHGSADGIAFANAIEVSARMVSHDLNQQIKDGLKNLKNNLPNKE